MLEFVCASLSVSVYVCPQPYITLMWVDCYKLDKEVNRGMMPALSRNITK